MRVVIFQFDMSKFFNFTLLLVDYFLIIIFWTLSFTFYVDFHFLNGNQNGFTILVLLAFRSNAKKRKMSIKNLLKLGLLR